jgi:hypothetical protein
MSFGQINEKSVFIFARFGSEEVGVDNLAIM